MEKFKGQEVWNHFLSEYNDQPNGWKFFHGRDSESHPVFIMVNIPSSTQYTMLFSAPYGHDPNVVSLRTGVGEFAEYASKQKFKSGLRPFEFTKEELINWARGKVPRKLITGKTYTTDELEELDSPYGLSGPFDIPTESGNLEDISTSQRELIQTLNKELVRLFQSTHYPLYV